MCKEKLNCAKCGKRFLLLDLQKCGECNVEPLCEGCVLGMNHACGGTQEETSDGSCRETDSRHR